MRLKKIEIIGFKSFADKTKLEFDAGITAVVGPNGCGKSNIADAFRWVLGEQSAKSMRGHKMPDVIFAGTTHRKPLNYAEVTITLTDVAGRLPIDFEEVAVTRRLHRNGESEYFINRHLVRLKDVQALFLDSGMGKDAYSIFEQGKIDQIINLSPLERRYIFEEAAGILRFLQRKKEALRKLEQTDLNVSRVKDIHKEVERQIIVLEEQAEKAREYKENKSVLDRLEKTLILTKWTGLQGKLAETRKKGHEQDHRITQENAHGVSLQNELSEAKNLLEEAERVLRLRGEDVFKARSAKEIKSKEMQNNYERIKDLKLKEKRWGQELEDIEERKKRREEERGALKSAQKILEKRHAELSGVVEAQSEKVKSLEEELATLRQRQQGLQKECLKQVQNENQCESEARQANLRLENAVEKHLQLQERKAKLLKQQGELVAQLEEHKSRLDDSAKSLEAQNTLFAKMESDLQQISGEMEKAQDRLDIINQEMGDSKARQKALQRLREDKEGFSSGSKRLLEESAKAGGVLSNKIKGLYEYFSPEKGMEASLASVMRFYAQTLVVATKADFEAVVAFSKQHKLKDISLLCLEGLVQSKKKVEGASLEPLSLHVVENAVSKHFLKGIYVADSAWTPLEAVHKAVDIEVCLADGTLVDRRSVIFFATHGENNVFLREAELKALDKRLQELDIEKKHWDALLSDIQLKRQEIYTQRVELDKTIRRAEMRHVEINVSYQKAQGDHEKLRTDTKVLEIEVSGIEKNMGELRTKLSELKIQHAKAKELAGAAQIQNETLTEQLTALANAFKVQVGDLRAKESALQQIIGDLSKQGHLLHVLEVKDLESIEQVKRLQDEIEMGKKTQQQIESHSLEVDSLLKQVEITLTDVTAVCKELEQLTLTRKSGIVKLENQINERRNVLKKHEADRNQTGIQLAQLEASIQSLETELRERYSLSLEEANQTLGPVEKSADQIDKEIRSLRQKIESAGDINMTSIEECEKHKTRYDFLNQQIDDLDVSKQELVAIIAQLDDESRTIFKQTFEQICANFKKNFKILFNGGDADLQFTETGDVLEAGIEIIAQPPGKQMRSINLLSGGEKCLTAMALLFAIFEVKPAPFCILDEIDAPLDDTNVERFVNIVKEFVDRCQFIIITHNKRTMAIADVLIGVSMEERGVSKLLTMDFAKKLVEV